MGRLLSERAPMATPQQVLRSYERGELVPTDVFVYLGKCLDEGDADGFVALLSTETAEAFRLFCDGCPHTEEGWSRTRAFGISTRTRAPSAEDVEKERGDEARCLRRAVELLRDRLAARQAEGGM